MAIDQHMRSPSPPPPIRYLLRSEIDIRKWDACVSLAGPIYGRSFILDAMTAGQWDGLVLDDYAAVMPLTWKRKFGINYLCQPSFCAMLGVFCRSGPAPVPDFLAAIPSRFRFWDIDLQENNVPLSATALPLKLTLRKNYFLALDKPYDAIQKRYRRLARRMLQRAASAQLSIERGADPDLVIDSHRRIYGHLYPNAAPLEKLSTCAAKAMETGNAATYLARRPGGGIAAFYLVFLDDRYVYSVLGGSTAPGKDTGAFYLLTDAVIRDHCPGNRIFRFEGSDLPGIAFFNEQFGPYPVEYPHLILNRLPFPINYLKPG